jgi:hypothetical protein
MYLSLNNYEYVLLYNPVSAQALLVFYDPFLFYLSIIREKMIASGFKMKYKIRIKRIIKLNLLFIIEIRIFPFEDIKLFCF